MKTIGAKNFSRRSCKLGAEVEKHKTSPRHLCLCCHCHCSWIAEMGNLCCSALNPGASDPPPAHCVPQPGAKVPAPAPAPARKAQPGSGPGAKVAQNAAPNTARPKTESLAEKLKREGQEKAAAAPAAGVLAGVVGGATDFSAGNQAALSGSTLTTEEAAPAKEREETGTAEAAKAKQTEEKAAAAARVAAEAEAARLAEAEAAARLAEEKRLAAEAAEKQRRAEAEAEKAAQDRPAAAAPAAAAEATVVASTGAKEKAEAADGFPEASVSVENVHLNVVGVGECASRSGACGVCTSYEIVHLMQSCGALARSAHTDSTLSPSLPCRVASKTSRYRTSLQQAAAKAPERMPIAAAGAVGGARRRAGEGSLEEKRGKAEARPRPCSALLPFR